MASPRKVLTIDLGTSTIKLGEFAVAPGGVLTLLRFGVEELGLDPNKEEPRGRFITAAVTKLLRETGIKERAAQLSISGQLAFTRFVKLPNVEASQIEQMVGFEAQQNVPFPIHEVVWDYQMMPTRVSGELEAIIVAIKKDVIDGEVAAVEAAGLQVKQVDVAPLAIFNAFRFNYPEVEESTLIIDMGARTTNLIFAEKNHFWVRSVPIAGNQISQNICNELQEPFSASETLKKGKGFVSLGGIYADPQDVDAARISKLIRSTMTRLHIDMNRSIAYYRTSLNGGAPKRILLTGGSSQLPYLDLFIVEKLNLPVEFFNPLQNVNLAGSLNLDRLQRDQGYIAEIVGLALRTTGACPSEITLNAPLMSERQNRKRKQPYLYAALVAWVLLFICLNLYFYQQIVLNRQAIAATNSNAEQLAVLSPQVGLANKNQKALEAELKDIVRLGQERGQWINILQALNDRIPLGLWLIELAPSYDAALDKQADKTPSRPGAPIVPVPTPPRLTAQNTPSEEKGTLSKINLLKITGYYHNNAKTQNLSLDDLNRFVSSLADNTPFNVDKSRLSETLPNATSSNTDTGAFAQKFELNLKLKEPVSITP